MTWNSSLSSHNNPEPVISPRMAELDALLALVPPRLCPIRRHLTARAALLTGARPATELAVRGGGCGFLRRATAPE